MAGMDDFDGLITLEGLRRAFEAVKPRELNIPEGAVVIQLDLRASVANSVATGDLIKLQTDGPLHTVLGKQGNTVFLVEGSYQRKRTGYDVVSESLDSSSGTAAVREMMNRAMGAYDPQPRPRKQKEFKPVVGKRRIRLDE